MSRSHRVSRSLELRTLAVIRALWPIMAAEGLQLGLDGTKWCCPPWACAIRSSGGLHRIDLRRGQLLLQATWRDDADGIRVLHFVPGQWDAELADDLALLRPAA